MTANRDLITSANSIDVSNENNNMITNRTGRAKRHQAAALSYTEVANQREQEYYNRASGCSVKAQKDNLYDYTPWEN
ncbi:MAG: hypothetical protein GZ087_04520 [Flavobacterium sp.]|nr:hypothetical protein [Flavobacterium sp.]